MATGKLSRRNFLKASTLTIAFLSTSVGVLNSTLALSSDKNKLSNKYVRGTMTRNWCEMCYWNCGINVFSNNGKVIRVEGQKDCPHNTGSLCAKAHAGIYQLYDPDRLKYPLIRTGERGDGLFRRATWDEALDLVATKLNNTIKAFGERGVALICHGYGQGAFSGLMKLIGSGNIAVPSFSQCLGAREIAWYLTYGMPLTSHEPTDGNNARCMMFIGRNVLESLQVGETKRVIQGMEKGAKLIAVDPRYSKTAMKANIWLKIKPGTDLALTLGMISYVLEKKLYNKKYVEKYCIGLNELKDAMKSYSLDWAARETEIPFELLEESINLLAEASPHCFIHPGKRLSRYGNDTQYSRAVAILNALLGSWETKGGFFSVNSFDDLKTLPLFDYSKLDEETFERADGVGTKYPLSPTNLGLTNGTLKAILTQEPYPIRALILNNSNIFGNSCNNSNIIMRTLSNLDFIVTSDIYMTESALYSDVILPDSTFFERQDPISIQSGKSPFVQYREPAIEPLYDTKGAWELCGLIGQKLGYSGKVKTVEEINQSIVEQLGISVEYLKSNGFYIKQAAKEYQLNKFEDFKFPTPSGKIELYSSTLKDLGFDPIPKYIRQLDPKKDGELRLIFGRQSQHTHTRTQNNRWLLATEGYKMSLWLPEKYAKEKGIKSGDDVIIVSSFKKSGPIKAFVTDRIYDEVLYIPHGYGRFSKDMRSAFAMQGAADSEFCSNGIDPITGTAALNLAFVKVEKA